MQESHKKKKRNVVKRELNTRELNKLTKHSTNHQSNAIVVQEKEAGGRPSQKVLYIEALNSEFTGAITFENASQVEQKDRMTAAEIKGVGPSADGANDQVSVD
jgi:hypothetical protein